MGSISCTPRFQVCVTGTRFGRSLPPTFASTHTASPKRLISKVQIHEACRPRGFCERQMRKRPGRWPKALRHKVSLRSQFCSCRLCLFSSVSPISAFLLCLSRAPLTQEDNRNTQDGSLIVLGALIIIMNLKIAELLMFDSAITRGCVHHKILNGKHCFYFSSTSHLLSQKGGVIHPIRVSRKQGARKVRQLANWGNGTQETSAGDRPLLTATPGAAAGSWPWTGWASEPSLGKNQALCTELPYKWLFGFTVHRMTRTGGPKRRAGTPQH